MSILGVDEPRAFRICRQSRVFGGAGLNAGLLVGLDFSRVQTSATNEGASQSHIAVCPRSDPGVSSGRSNLLTR